MPLPPQYRVKSCMGCIPLQRGCIILGCIGMVCSLLEIRANIHGLIDFELSVKQCRKNEGLGSTEVKTNDTIENFPRYFVHDKCPSDRFVNLVRVILGFASFTYVIYFIMTTMMIYGVITSKPKMMTPWMVWEIAQIFFSIVSLFGLGYGNPSRFTSVIEVLMMIYFILVVTSYYLQLKEAEERRDGVTVMAITQNSHDMMVVIPTMPKDDPPPPYPGFPSSFNPVYDPTGTGLPLYSPNNPTSVSLPPEYGANTLPQLNQASHVAIPGSPAVHSNLNTPSSVVDGCGEAAPLVGKPPLPSN